MLSTLKKLYNPLNVLNIATVFLHRGGYPQNSFSFLPSRNETPAANGRLLPATMTTYRPRAHFYIETDLAPSRNLHMATKKISISASPGCHDWQ